jgi:mRNA-degrading endonuclease RelE of RelBE toxin-antitoxin system
MEWIIFEHRDIEKTMHKLPKEIIKKYELWKNIVASHGPEGLRGRPGLHDEKLTGTRKHQRSSRLSLKYRVIYEVAEQEVTVYVIELTLHKY